VSPGGSGYDGCNCPARETGIACGNPHGALASQAPAPPPLRDNRGPRPRDPCLDPGWRPCRPKGAMTQKRSHMRSTGSWTLWQSKSGGDDQRDTQHARPPTGVTRNIARPSCALGKAVTYEQKANCRKKNWVGSRRLGAATLAEFLGAPRTASYPFRITGLSAFLPPDVQHRRPVTSIRTRLPGISDREQSGRLPTREAKADSGAEGAGATRRRGRF
jgi:hypothetical protein